MMNPVERAILVKLGVDVKDSGEYETRQQPLVALTSTNSSNHGDEQAV